MLNGIIWNKTGLKCCRKQYKHYVFCWTFFATPCELKQPIKFWCFLYAFWLKNTVTWFGIFIYLNVISSLEHNFYFGAYVRVLFWVRNGNFASFNLVDWFYSISTLAGLVNAEISHFFFCKELFGLMLLFVFDQNNNFIIINFNINSLWANASGYVLVVYWLKRWTAES